MNQYPKKSSTKKSGQVQPSIGQDSTSAGDSALNSVTLDQSDSDTENNTAARRFTTAKHVSPHLSNRTKRQRIRNDDDFMQDLLDDKSSTNEDDLLYPFPFHGMRQLLRCNYKPNGKDPRGPRFDEGEPLPEGHCDSCKCELTLCHDTRFGLYCGLRVAELIQEKGADKLGGSDVSTLLRLAYNEVLRVETVQQIGILDTYNDYDPPQCVLDKSMKNIMRHFLYEKFTIKMKTRLQDGSRGRWGSGTHGFYTALSREEEAEREIEAEEEAI